MTSLLLADSMDQKMVLALRKNARVSIAELASKLKITRATVRKRIQKLESSGTIVGYTVVLSSDISETPIRGLMQINVGEFDSEKVIEKLTNLNEIIAIHSANGKWDIILELASESLPGFDKLIRKIKQTKGVVNSETSILLSTTRNNKATVSEDLPNLNKLKTHN